MACRVVTPYVRVPYMRTRDARPYKLSIFISLCRGGHWPSAYQTPHQKILPNLICSMEEMLFIREMAASAAPLAAPSSFAYTSCMNA
jgi:hypothetical protein